VGQTVLDRVSDGARVEPREAGLALVRKVRVRRGDRARLVQPGDLVGGQLPADRAEVLPQLRGLNIKVKILNLSDLTEAFADDRFSFEKGDATNLPAISDRTFDLVHSNSLIEHVGRWTDMKRMAANVRRLADNYYIQTPYFWFPMEPHFRTIGYHWMPPQWRVKLLLRRSLGFYPMAADIHGAMDCVEGIYLLDKNQFKALFPDGRIVSEKVCGLTKSLIADSRLRLPAACVRLPLIFLLVPACHPS